MILGVASGDRPTEYPVLGIDFGSRAETYRSSIKTMRDLWSHAAHASDAEDKVLPVPVAGTIPLVAVGRGGQTTAWAAENMDAFMTYPRPGGAMGTVVSEWNTAVQEAPAKPVITTTLVDLASDPHAPAEPIRFGARLGRQTLIDYLRRMEDTGVAHVALNFRPSQRPVEEVLREVAEHVLPAFDKDPSMGLSS